MNAVVQQLNQWRLRERLVRLAWGGGRWLAIVGAVLAAACLTDWAVDRYSGSQTWRDFLRTTWVLSNVDPLSAGETPLWFRALMTLAEVALAAGLAYLLLVRPWLRTPPIDVLAGDAEKAHTDFDHRLVTALQLNRPTAKTQGMSPVLIAEVTREAGEIASRHNLLKLVDYRRLRWAAAVAAPIVLGWFLFLAANSSLAAILIQRQCLLGGEIPRRTHLNNVTQDVWPTGAEVVVRYEVTGEFDPEQEGVLRIVPEGQPEEFYALVYEKPLESGNGAYFITRLPAASRDFDFQARLGGGRTRSPGHVTFEPPPQLAPDDDRNPPLVAFQVLPRFLGLAPDGTPYTRRTESSNRGDIVDALPRSSIVIEARFNKPVSKAVLIPMERAEGVRERDLPRLAPGDISADRKSMAWYFPTTPRMIAYRIELVDDRKFTNPLPIKRNIRMWEDRPPTVEFMRETTRNPDPDDPKGQGSPNDYTWDMPLSPQGRVMVIYHARSELGVSQANIRYRVIPRGVQLDQYPEWYKNIHHPREDKELRVYFRLNLLPAPDPLKNKLGEFISDLGLFRYSLRGVPDQDQGRVDVGFYQLPSPNPATIPGELEAGGRRNFEVSELKKMMPDGTFAKLEVGDTVELYVEAFDKLPGPDGKPSTNRPAGYTREAKRKIVMAEPDVLLAILQRDEEKQKRTEKLRELANDQISVFREKQK